MSRMDPTKPFREAMYGWMRLHLMREGDGGAVKEGDVATMPVNDPRLICDSEGQLMSSAPSIVALASRKAAALGRSNKSGQDRSAYVKNLTAPREPESDYQRARTIESLQVVGRYAG